MNSDNFNFLLAFLLVASLSFAQNVLTLNPYNVNQEDLVSQIRADTTANGGIVAGRIYELIGGEVYLVTEQFYLEEGFTLHMRSSNEQKAIVYLFPTGSGDNPQEPPGYFVRSRGGDLILEDLAISAFYEPGDDPAAGSFDYFYNVQGGLFRTDNEGASFYATNCIFSNTAGQIIRTNASTQTVKFEDCIFANLGALSTSNFGAGKGIDLRESSCDEFILVNNTFLNYQDRPVRHYNYGDPVAGTGDIAHGIIDHNTFVNGMGFHGLLSLGNVGAEMEITNNLFVDAFAAGEDSTDETRTAEWANTGEQYGNGNNRMAWIFAAPTGNTAWTVSNNYYAVTAEGQSFFDTYSEIGVGEPLSNYIMGELGAGAANAFTMIPDPELSNVPDLMLGLMTYYVVDAGKTKDTPNDTWDPATQDMDRRPITYYVNDFDVSYSTGSAAYTGAVGGFPAGDLNAFPGKKSEWELTDVRMDDKDGLVKDFALEQNYPNPFNPSTKIKFAIPKQSHVTLKIYNVLGQEVAELVNQEMRPGSYIVDFNAGRLSSGIYFYSIQAEQFSVTKKMMLLK